MNNPHELRYFTVKAYEKDLYVSIQKILTCELSEHRINDPRSFALPVFPEIQEIQGDYHTKIVDDILKANDNIMNMSSFSAFFHSLAYNLTQFKTLNIHLLFAMREIAQYTNYQSINPLIKDGIDQLLSTHLSKMADSNLFYKNLPLLMHKFYLSIKTKNSVMLMNAEENKFALVISEQCLKVIDAEGVIKDREIMQGKEERKELEKIVGDNTKNIADLKKTINDLDDLVKHHLTQKNTKQLASASSPKSEFSPSI